MDVEERLDWLTGWAERAEIGVRRERLGGEGGGLCTLKGRRILFLDLDADVQTRYETTLLALGGLPELQNHHIPPIVAEDLERLESSGAD